MSNPKRILRRALLATTAAAAATGDQAAAAMKPELPAADVELVALAKEYLAHHAESVRLSTTEGSAKTEHERDDIDEQGKAIGGRMQEIEAAMVKIDAKTPVGDRAKAAVGLLRLGDGDGPLNMDHDLVWSLLTNIVDRGA
jgi:hypothetical protein